MVKEKPNNTLNNTSNNSVNKKQVKKKTVNNKPIKEKEPNILDEYFFYQESKTKLYGDSTIVFMRIGDFFEAYATEIRGYDLSKISEIANIQKTKKNKKEEVSDSNPYMVGFNHTALNKFLKIFVDNNFTVVVVDQVTPPPKPKRKITGIYSSGTFINDTISLDANNLVSIYIENERQLNGQHLMCIGLSSVDITTGQCLVYEVYSRQYDDKYALDETYRFIISQNPKEIILSVKDDSESINKDFILSYLEIEDKHIHYTNKVNKSFNRLSYQEEFFKKIYKNTGMLSILEYMDIEKLNYVRISLITLLDFVYKRDETYLYNLNKPKVFMGNEHLILGNNAIYQLNILENNCMEMNNVRYKSLFDVVNHTSTAMGRRFIKHTICHPLNDIDEINLRYQSTEELLNDSIYIIVEKHLETILDIERLSRRICLKVINPCEFANFVDSLRNVFNVYDVIKQLENCSKYIPKEIYIDSLNNFIEECLEIFDLDELRKYNLNDITGSFFNKGVYTQIDALNDKVVVNLEIIENIGKILSHLIIKSGKMNKTKSDELLKLKYNKVDKYHLTLTKKRSDVLREVLKDKKTIDISETTSLNVSSLFFKDAAVKKDGSYSDTKIFLMEMDNQTNDIVRLKEKMIFQIKQKYMEFLELYSKKYNKMFTMMSYFISKIDFLKSNAKTAKLFNYVKPFILMKKRENGFIDAHEMRHPIIERIRTDVQYVPHDIRLGQQKNNTMDGMLLYGLNSAGKSSLMKSIGLNLIMAQCGMYVAASSYRYSPYDSLFARITGSDNIFKGLSQFSLEMMELRAILKRNNPKTLVIGDEVCRGTEHLSGNSIVAATLIHLSKSQSSFIFATHLHEIADMDKIKKLENVGIFHLSVEYDTKTDSLIFDRILKDGSGSSVYGLTVAKYIIKDDEFMQTAHDIMNDLIQKPSSLISEKVSKYNSHVYVDSCQICGKKNNEQEEYVGMLDTHHINFQSDCDDNGFVIGKSYLKMNNKCNLAILCKRCHVKVHHNRIKVSGYKDTSNGRILDYEIIPKLVKKKKKKIIKA